MQLIDKHGNTIDTDDKPQVSLADGPAIVHISITREDGRALIATLYRPHIEKLRNHLNILLESWG